MYELDLRNKFTFWYSGSDNRKNMTQKDFEQNLKEISSFSTVKDFWKIFLKLKLPSEIPLLTKLFLFYGEIPPIWENPKNKNGGRLYLKVLTKASDLVWQNLWIEFISSSSDYIKYVNGIQMVKRNEDVVVFSIWVNSNNSVHIERIYDLLSEKVPIPRSICIDYQDHPQYKMLEKNYRNNNYKSN